MCRKNIKRHISKGIDKAVVMTAILMAMVLSSCVLENPEADETGDPLVGGISVIINARNTLSTRGDSEDSEAPDGETDEGKENPGDDYEIVGDDGNGGIDYNRWDIDELTPYTLDFDENSILQVSQKTRNTNPFQSEDLIYKFEHIEGSDDAAWDDENSYNFSAYEADEPLEWNKIGDRGSWNGGFALFCLYFPDETDVRQKDGDYGATLYSVMQDQSTVENLKKSDILGAYHSTPKLFSRIRFRLFHLMTYVRIRLYVPVYDDETHTGYRENALESATLNNVTPDFVIDWNAIRSSDTQGPAVSPLDGEGSIVMYQHPVADSHKIMKIRYKDFLRDNYFDQGITGDYDYVRVYDFSVIIPLQKGMVDENGQQGNFTSTDFLNFNFRTNSGALTKYVFNQSLSANTTQSSLEMNQGIYQYLQLYLPRVGNQAVCVGATVNPWGQMGTDMLLTPDDPDLQ